MTNFNKTFYTLTGFFIFYFYLIPLLIIMNVNDSGNSVYSYSMSDEKIITALVALFIFLIGFFTTDIIKYFSTISYRQTTIILNTKVKYFFWVLLLIYILFLFYQLFDSDRGIEVYAIRRGEAESNLVQFFLNNLFGAIKFTLLLVILGKNNKNIILLFLIFSTYVEFFGSIGRLSLLLNLVLILIVFMNLKAQTIARSSFIILLILLPIIFNLKSIIYVLSTGNGDLNISNFDFDLDFDVYLNNFAHPLMSLINIEPLYEKLGYRYFYDYVHGFLFYFKIIGLDFGASLTYYNTDNLIGIFESVMPPGYLAFGYMQLGYIGVFVSGLFYKQIGIMANKILLMYAPKSEAGVFLLSFMAANSFYHGEVRIMVMTLFFPFAMAYLLSFYLRKRTLVKQVVEK
jgi:hypothetical protein